MRGKVSLKQHQFKLHLLLQKPSLGSSVLITKLCIKSVKSQEKLAGTCYGNLGSRTFLKRYLRNKERFMTLPATQRLADSWYIICQVLPLVTEAPHTMNIQGFGHSVSSLVSLICLVNILWLKIKKLCKEENAFKHSDLS